MLSGLRFACLLALLDVTVSWLPAAGHRRGARGSCPLSLQMRRGSRGPRAPPQRDVPMINEIIPHEEMRVMIEKQGESDEMLGIMRKEDAIAAARERDLDLVLIADKSEPVVCKIVSYDKYRFTKEKKAKEQKIASKNPNQKERGRRAQAESPTKEADAAGMPPRAPAAPAKGWKTNRNQTYSATRTSRLISSS